MNRMLSAFLGTLAVVAAMGPSASAANGKLVISFLDIGQGDAELLQLPTGDNVLIDAGDNGMEERIVQDLRDRGVKSLDMVIMTHPHADHIGAMDAVLQNFPVRLMLDSGSRTGTRTYTKLLKLIDEKHIALKLGRPGMTKNYGPVKLEVLAPAEPLLKDTKSDLNNNSIITKWTYGKFAVLMTGDVESEGLARLLKTNDDLHATVLKVPHHGSRYTTGMDFLERVRPEVAVISAGQNNDYHHPHKQAVERLEKIGAKIYVTKDVGTVTVTTDGKTYQVQTER
jgi:competence protein ComEC